MIKLKTTDEQFEGLHRDLDKTRRTSETVKVSRQALTNLLLDHGQALTALKVPA